MGECGGAILEGIIKGKIERKASIMYLVGSNIVWSRFPQGVYMKPQIKFFSFGFFFACLSFLGIFAYILYHDGNIRMLVHDQALPSGKTIQITSFNLVWGVEHSDRNPGNDCFNLEYVSNVPHAEPEERDQEALEVFELIRPVSEQWGFKRTSISAFRSTQRKGAYDIYHFDRASDGKWSLKRYPAKVHSND